MSSFIGTSHALCFDDVIDRYQARRRAVGPYHERICACTFGLSDNGVVSGGEDAYPGVGAEFGDGDLLQAALCLHSSLETALGNGEIRSVLNHFAKDGVDLIRGVGKHGDRSNESRPTLRANSGGEGCAAAVRHRGREPIRRFG